MVGNIMMQNILQYPFETMNKNFQKNIQKEKLILYSKLNIKLNN